jgi:hypothetical protein
MAGKVPGQGVFRKRGAECLQFAPQPVNSPPEWRFRNQNLYESGLGQVRARPIQGGFGAPKAWSEVDTSGAAGFVAENDHKSSLPDSVN